MGKLVCWRWNGITVVTMWCGRRDVDQVRILGYSAYISQNLGYICCWVIWLAHPKISGMGFIILLSLAGTHVRWRLSPIEFIIFHLYLYESSTRLDINISFTTTQSYRQIFMIICSGSWCQPLYITIDLITEYVNT